MKNNTRARLELFKSGATLSRTLESRPMRMQREPMWMQDCWGVLLTYSVYNRDEASLPLIMTDELSYRLAGLRSRVVRRIA